MDLETGGSSQISIVPRDNIRDEDEADRKRKRAEKCFAAKDQFLMSDQCAHELGTDEGNGCSFFQSN